MSIAMPSANMTPGYTASYEWRDVGGGLRMLCGGLTKQQRESAVSFKEIMEQETERPPAPDYPTIDFSVHAPTDIESTGDENADKRIREALDYFGSCFDLTNSADYFYITAAEDLTGMTKTEKYAAIYQKYQHCYGENFLEGGAVDTCYIPSRYNVYNHILDSFHSEVEKACGKNGAEKARRELLYGDCESDEEVRAAIIRKYMQDSPDGRLTHRNYFKMTYEMDLCGVGGGISRSLHNSAYVPQNIFEYLNHNPRGNNSSAEFLDSYVTQTDIQDFYNSYSVISKYSFDTSSYLPALSQIISAITPDKNSTLKNTIDSLLFNNNLA